MFSAEDTIAVAVTIRELIDTTYEDLFLQDMSS